MAARGFCYSQTRGGADGEYSRPGRAKQPVRRFPSRHIGTPAVTTEGGGGGLTSYVRHVNRVPSAAVPVMVYLQRGRICVRSSMPAVGKHIVLKMRIVVDICSSRALDGWNELV